jgi:hypothetical protein
MMIGWLGKDILKILELGAELGAVEEREAKFMAGSL